MQAASHPPVPKLDRKRLAAVLELISSDQPGERQAAAEAAHRLIRAAGARWEDVLGDRAADRPPAAASPGPRRRSPDWRVLAARCRSHPGSLTEWERGFVASVSRQGRVSRRQYAILARLAGRVQP